MVLHLEALKMHLERSIILAEIVGRTCEAWGYADPYDGGYLEQMRESLRQVSAWVNNGILEVKMPEIPR